MNSRVRRWTDAVGYALGVTVLVAVGAWVVVVLLGGTPVGISNIMFIVGFLLFGLGAVALRPTPPWRDGPIVSLDREGPAGFHAVVQRLLPERYTPTPEEALSTGARLFLSGVVLLAVSFVLSKLLYTPPP